MIDDNRIKEAQRNVSSYQSDNLMWKISSFRADIFRTYKRNYKESFDVAKKLFDDDLSCL